MVAGDICSINKLWGLLDHGNTLQTRGLGTSPATGSSGEGTISGWEKLELQFATVGHSQITADDRVQPQLGDSRSQHTEPMVEL